MAAGRGAPVVVPHPTSRPGSAGFSDAYGALNFGPSTVQSGSNGPAKIAAADAAAEAFTPVTVNARGAFALLGQPAGVLGLLLAGLAVWYWLENR
jgi:hypothetical protein